MNREQELRERSIREAWLRNSPTESEIEQIGVADSDDGEDWPLLTLLFGGLALALAVNTFIGLIPG